MKRNLFLFALASLSACGLSTTSVDIKMDTVALQNATPVQTPDPANTNLPEDAPVETTGISGDFNGDGVIDSAWSECVKPAAGPDDPDIYSIKFNATAIPAIEGLEGHTRLINEGDLNGDGKPEISLFQAPIHGTVYYMTTWSLHPGGWKQIAKPWLIPTAGEYLSDASLQRRIELENDTVYYWESDFDDDAMVVKRKVLQLVK